MQPISNPSTPVIGKCSETSSNCVIWDGPDINCLGVNLYKGQSIEVVIYNTAKTLCDLLAMLNIDMILLECLTPPSGVIAPQNIVELSQLIITKLCELNQDIVDLQNTGSVPVYVDLLNCADHDIIANCPSGTTTEYTDSNGNVVTKLLLISADGHTSPAVQYLVLLICDLLCRMTTAESEIAHLRTDVDNLLNQAAGALPPVQLPCDTINGIGPGINQQIVNPIDPAQGVIPDMASKLCDVLAVLTGPNDITTLNTYPDVNSNVACYTGLSTATPLGVYPLMSPPPTTLEDLGAYSNPTTLQEIMSNLWIAVCDLRNFAQIVKDNCCPVLCNSIVYDLGAGAPNNSAGGARETMRIILTGDFINYFGNTISANSSIPLPGFDPSGPPSYYNGVLPYTITIEDEHLNVATFTEPSVVPLFTSGNFFDATNLTIPPNNLNPLDNYTITISGTIQAPDYTICNFNETVIVPAVCDNQPLTSVDIEYVGYDGVTITVGLPSGGWPLSGTVAQYYEIEIYSAAGTMLDSGTIDFAYFPGNEIFIYSDSDNVLPDPSACAGGGCGNFFQTDQITPNAEFYIKVRLDYNCGFSAWFTSNNFTTFVPIEITIPASIAGTCALAGNFALVSDPSVPSGDISTNFNDTIDFIPSQNTVVTVFAKAGTTFGYILNTPYILDTPFAAATACTINNGVKCWGPPSLYKYASGGIGGFYFKDLISQYTDAGCFDYIDCKLTGDLTYLSYTGSIAMNNVDNSGTASQQPGAQTAVYDNSGIGYDALTIPLAYGPSDPSPIKINVNPVLHTMNGGITPKLYISITDDPSTNYLTNQGLIYFPAATVTNNGTPTKPAGFPVTVSYNSKTKQWLGSSYVSSLPALGWTSVFAAHGDTPTGVPVFLRITIYKWSASGGYITNPNNVYYVTSDWINANLSGISSPTGFDMSGIGLQLRDKVAIEWSTGVANNDNNSDYMSTGTGGPAVGDKTYGKVTITQDPYSAITPTTIGPFVACDARGTSDDNDTYTNAKTGTTALGTGCCLWGDTVSYPQKYYTILNQNNKIEFIVTGDTLISWEIGSALPYAC